MHVYTYRKENSRKESFAKTAQQQFRNCSAETAAARYHNYTIPRIIGLQLGDELRAVSAASFDERNVLGVVDETKDAVERGSTHVLPNRRISNVGRLGRQVKEFSIAERSAAESGIRNG